VGVFFSEHSVLLTNRKSYMGFRLTPRSVMMILLGVPPLGGTITLHRIARVCQR